MSLFDRRTLRWSLFDVASSTFAALVPPFFGLYFVAVVAPVHPGSVAVWGLVVAASIVLAGLLAPLVGAFADSMPWVPLVVVALLGLVYGSLQSVFRSLYASLVEADRAAEFFGFNSLAGRLSAAIGPVIFGTAVALLGSQSLALVTLLAPLAAGVALLVMPGGNSVDSLPGAYRRKTLA